MIGGLEAALKWMGQKIKADPGADRLTLADEASRTFDLSPLEGKFLVEQFGRTAGR